MTLFEMTQAKERGSSQMSRNLKKGHFLARKRSVNAQHLHSLLPISATKQIHYCVQKTSRHRQSRQLRTVDLDYQPVEQATRWNSLHLRKQKHKSSFSYGNDFWSMKHVHSHSLTSCTRNWCSSSCRATLIGTCTFRQPMPEDKERVLLFLTKGK